MNRRHLIAVAVGVALLAVWALWPSPYGKVKNLDSRGTNVIAFGDSLTAGYGAGAGEDYPSKLTAMSGIPVVNAGRSGDTTESALGRLEADVLDRDPRIVIVGLGGNDYLRGEPIASTEANLRTIVKKIQEKGAMVVLLGFRFPSLNANYQAMYERVAGEERCLLVDRSLKGVLTDPRLRSDAIHPNAQGYALMAERISPPLKKLLAKAKAKVGR
jgi:acyl-CoA thioesterase I